MTFVRVFIATTEGPAEVQRITEEEPNVRSVVCLDGKALALPISRDYDAFVRVPTGVVEAAYGHSAFRLDVSQPISGGMSWQLGAFAAHALFAAGRLAQKAQPAEQAIWLTGEVDRDLEVGTVDDLLRKIERSAPLFAELAESGTPITLFVPHDNLAELDPTWASDRGLGKGITQMVPVRDATEVLSFLKLDAAVPGSSAARLRRAPAKRARSRVLWALGTGGTLALTAVALWWYQTGALSALGPAPRFWVAVPTGVELTAVESRAPMDGTCAAVRFGASDPEIREVVLAAGSRTVTANAGRLCGLEFRVTNSGEPAQLWVFAARAGEGAAALHTRTLLDGRAFAAEESVDLEARVPRHMTVALIHRFAVVALRAEAAERRRELIALADRLGKDLSLDEWQGLLRSLERSGFELIRRSHEISP